MHLIKVLLVYPLVKSHMSQPVLLCIDDEASGLALRKMVLESKGYSVLTAERGKAGLEIFESQHVDLVVLDYAMPEMNGREVAAEMKRRKPHVQILMLSAYLPLPEDVLQFVDAYLTKGESPEPLFAKIHLLLNTFTPKSADVA